ncbi:MAG: 50S ribosomal protein L21 [Bacteroidales bacterium]|nr:50S ribosomal protein L21 [Bacteroidales bacterium]NLK82105.1 50S ribosomal protein L21 [Bacteroidales bacterium]HPY82474.1 50S ribosomal protein L21 [Bacteroidales bacterium]
MYAIVDIAGQQFKVSKNDTIFVNRLQNQEGESVDFESVLLVQTDKKVNIGTPQVKGAKVTAKIISHLKGDKVIIFKKKRRKGYRVKNGFRPSLTQIQIEEITA